MDAKFAFACQRVEDLPPAALSEVAVAGRSNCGKSSLINALVGRKKLARTSSTPGRTQQIIFFHILEMGPNHLSFYLVDLPGYGYARASKTQKHAWGKLVTWYIDNRPNLSGLLLLNDIRRTPAVEERDLLRWAASRGIQTQVVLTKSDKLSRSRRFGAAQAAKEALDLQRRPETFSIMDLESVRGLQTSLLQLLDGEV